MSRLAATALLSAMVAVAAGGCAMSTSPGAVGVWRPQLLTATAEQTEARASAWSAALQGKAVHADRLDADAALTLRVRKVTARLIAEVGAFRPDALKWRWQISVFDADELNAFCLPGGRIGVSAGLVKRLDLSDAELAFVLGHEIAHALREHTREKASQNEWMTAIVQGIAVFGGRYAALQSVAADAGSQVLVALPFSRTMESEADLIGLELMARAGYDPRLASAVWTKLLAAPAAGRPLPLLSTHPGDAQRLDALDAAVPKVMALYEAHRAGAEGGDVEAVGAPLPRPSLAPADPPAAVRPDPKIVVGQDSRQVERLARAAGCGTHPLSALADKGPGFETYAVTCSNRDAMSFRCEFGHCRVGR